MKKKYLCLIFLVTFVHVWGNNSNAQILEAIILYKGDISSIKGPLHELKLIRNFPIDYYQIYTIDGLGSFYIDSRVDIIKNHLRRGEIWEKNIVDLINQYAIKGTTVVDVGAHVGTHTLSMSKKVGEKGRVVALEPQKKLYAELVMNMDINGCKNVWCFRCAAGSKFMQIEMNPPVIDNEGGTGIGKGGDQASMIPLDSLELDHVSLLKIDVENAELDVLKGARRTILKYRPVMIIEIMGNTYVPIENRSEHIYEITQYIKEMGYQLSYIEGSWSDWLAIPLEKGL